MDGTVITLSNEQALVCQASTDPTAFAIIYDHYFSRVYNYIRYRVVDPSGADDLTAQVFEKALAKIAQYNPRRGPFAAWLFAIARNTVGDYLRKQQRIKLFSLEILSELPARTPAPEQVVSTRETRHQLLQAVQMLSEIERDLIALKFAGGISNRRIAELTGLTESNVGVILYRAMRRLRVALTSNQESK